MNLRLIPVPFERYAAEVLPQTHALWSGGLPFDAYVERTRRVANTPYGRKHYSTLALSDDGTRALATFKRYERAAHAGTEILHAIGIGAVFTPAALRGSGYATAMLALALDEARSAKVDFAFLYSDIHPQFYRECGFIDLPSRSISVRADSLSALRVRADAIGARDWSAMRACFEALERGRTASLLRTPVFWSHLRERASGGDNFCAREGPRVVAYVLGRREPRSDTYVMNEIAFADAHQETAQALLRGAAGDLRRIAGWLPPLPARAILPRGSVRPRSHPVLMIAPLSEGGRRFVTAALERSSGDPVWIGDHV